MGVEGLFACGGLASGAAAVLWSPAAAVLYTVGIEALYALVSVLVVSVSPNAESWVAGGLSRLVFALTLIMIITVGKRGTERMDRNYALEPDEVDAGFVLACQSHPVTDTAEIDFDV